MTIEFLAWWIRLVSAFLLALDALGLVVSWTVYLSWRDQLERLHDLTYVRDRIDALNIFAVVHALIFFVANLYA